MWTPASREIIPYEGPRVWWHDLFAHNRNRPYHVHHRLRTMDWANHDDHRMRLSRRTYADVVRSSSKVKITATDTLANTLQPPTLPDPASRYGTHRPPSRTAPRSSSTSGYDEPHSRRDGAHRRLARKAHREEHCQSAGETLEHAHVYDALRIQTRP